jgi:hypothetical protein
MPPPFGAATGLRGVPGPPDDGVSTAWTGAARARTWGCFAAAGIYLFSNGPDDKSVKLALRDNCHERLLALTPGGEGTALERGRKRPGQPQQRAEHVDADGVALETKDPQVMTRLVSRRGGESLPSHVLPHLAMAALSHPHDLPHPQPPHQRPHEPQHHHEHLSCRRTRRAYGPQ